MAEKKKILIVEDEPIVSRALELKLNSEGYTTTMAANGQEALDLLAKNKYSLVLLDLIMPVLDGFDVLREMKKNNNKTKVIVATNLSQEDDQKRARELGAVDYFVKSETPISEVVEKVEKYI